MSSLNDFLDEDRALIVSMPVRVGFWISHADDAKGTQRDDEKERLALEKALKVRSKQRICFINDVCEYALTNKAEWGSWSASSDAALADLPKALRRVEDVLTAKDLKDYKSAIYRVAGIVAQAAAEGGEDDLSREVMGSKLFSRLLDKLSVKTDMSVPDNISATVLKNSALKRIGLLLCRTLCKIWRPVKIGIRTI